MNKNESKVIEEYLKKLDSCTFLSKKEEQEIGTRINKIEQQILQTCLKSRLFYRELLTLAYNVNRNMNNVVKYSKHIIEASSKDEKQKIANYFKVLKTMLLDYAINGSLSISMVNLPHIVTKIKFTSSSIHQMIASVKKTYNTVSELEDESLNIFKFLEVNSQEEYDALINKCKDSTFRVQLAQSLYCPESTLIKKLNRQEEIIKYFATNELDPNDIRDLQQLVAGIETLELTYKKDRETLIHANLPLVVSRAKRFSNSDLDLEDLIQEGNIGLIKAIDKYEPEKDVKIITYATWWIDQAIRRAISNKGKLVRVPIHTQNDIKILNQTYFKLSQKLLREPTLTEISEESTIPLKSIQELNTSALHEIGLDSEVYAGVQYSDIISDDSQETLFSSTSKALTKDRIRLALSDLSPRSEKIIRLRFGIGEKCDHTLESIGTKFNITKERTRQIVNQAFQKLKNRGALED